ncbi:MAG: DNA-3-methyladenine glycosylase 2 family protein [Clostridia bacterium]|nr:DNA-3-methyladenine glycosylase 2 family protein [Clostridia bacterium]
MSETFIIDRPNNFDITQIFDCGQCFRFNRHKSKENTYCGVAFSRYLEITQQDNQLYINTNSDDFENIWSNFFDLSTDYNSILSTFSDDEVLFKAASFSSGIRILRQDPWEALCSFIISQNNNIPRIKGIIENMSRAFGEKFRCGDDEYYAFPTAQALYEAGEDKIFSLKTGFRAKYIYDCAKLVTLGELDLEKIKTQPTTLAMQSLQQVKGIGPKVASCALLFGFSKYDAFPVDVWVKKILEKYYKDKTCSHFSSQYAGIAQQYLFYYERCLNNVYL